MDSIKLSYKGYDTVETAAEFSGGPGSWVRYLQQNFVYPKESIKKDAEGMTAVRFIVNTLGNVEDPYIFRSVEYYIDKEAMRLIVRSPGWTPAVQYGKKVKSYMVQPVVFRLN
jgi:protein TonB